MGKKVAFGTITQLVLENVDAQELQEIIEFCIALGLPVTLQQLGVHEVTKEKLWPWQKLLVLKMTHYTICHLRLHQQPFVMLFWQRMLMDIIS